MFACGSCPMLPRERQKRRDWGCESDSAQGNYTNWHFTPHVHTPSPGANQSRGQAWHRCCLPLCHGRNCSADICLRVCVSRTDTHILRSPLSLQVLLRAAFLWNHQGAGRCPTQIMRDTWPLVWRWRPSGTAVCVCVCVFYAGIARLSHISLCMSE